MFVICLDSRTLVRHTRAELECVCTIFIDILKEKMGLIKNLNKYTWFSAGSGFSCEYNGQQTP